MAMVGAPVIVHAQATAPVPLNAGVYRDLDALAAAGLIDSLIVGQRPYSGAGRHELQAVAVERRHGQLDADDTVAAQSGALLQQPVQRAVPGVLDQLPGGRHVDDRCRTGPAPEKPAAAPGVPAPGVAPADVVHRAAHDLPDRREPDRPQRGELRHRQPGRERLRLALRRDAPLRGER